MSDGFASKIKEKNYKENVLIVDRVGLLGGTLSQRLDVGFSIIFVGREGKLKIPSIPDAKYLYIYLVFKNDKESKVLLSEFLKKAKKDNSTLIILSDLRIHNETALKEALFYKKTRVIVFGDLFGFPLDGTTFINRFLSQAAWKGIIEVFNTGEAPLFPVLIDDVIDAIMTISFSKDSSNNIFLIFPKHHITELGLSRIIQKRHPQIGIDFIKGREEKTPQLPLGEYFFDQDKNMEQKLNDAFKYFLKEKSLFKEGNKRESKKPTGLVPSIIFSFFFFVITTIILPFLVTVCALWLGKYALFSTKAMIERGNLGSAKNTAGLSREIFNIARASSAVMLAEAHILSMDRAAIPIVKAIDLGTDVSDGLNYVLSSIVGFKEVITGKTNQSEKDFYDSVQSLRGAIRIYKKIQAGEAIRIIDSKSFEKLGRFQKSIELLEEIADVSPTLFGFNGKKTYLILFQNNMELRPGGGFIGSYGLIAFDRGRIVDFSIHDVYDADGQLKGHIEPPYPIRRYLPSVHWYLRDSNFDVDFAKSAKDSASLFYKETGIIVDGVLGVDVTLLKDVLSVLGPVRVFDYNQTVTQENVYLLTQTYAEKNFFPGSSAKKDFLRSLFSSIVFEFSSKKTLPYIKLTETLFSSIEGKHIVFAVSNPKIQNILDVNGVSSSLINTREEDQNKVIDFLGINEANLGVNKANYFIKKDILHKVSIDKDGRVFDKLDISYHNTSTKTSWPGGEYKSYLRIITPRGARLLSVLFDKEEQEIKKAVTDPAVYEARGFKAPKGLEVETIEKDKHTIFGFLITVPIESRKIISVSYELAQKIPLSNPSFSYDLIVFKQPGTEKDPFSFSVSYPNTFKALKTPEFITQLGEDLNIAIDFAKR